MIEQDRGGKAEARRPKPERRPRPEDRNPKEIRNQWPARCPEQCYPWERCGQPTWSPEMPILQERRFACPDFGFRASLGFRTLGVGFLPCGARTRKMSKNRLPSLTRTLDCAPDVRFEHAQPAAENGRRDHARPGLDSGRRRDRQDAGHNVPCGAPGGARGGARAHPCRHVHQ